MPHREMDILKPRMNTAEAQRLKLKAQGQGQAPSRGQNQEAEQLRSPVSHGRGCGWNSTETMQGGRQERGLQAAEACVMYGARAFPDSFFDSLNCEWRGAYRWIWTVAAGGRFCGLKAALLSPSLHNYDLGSKPAWPAHRSSPGPWNLVLSLSFELYPLSFSLPLRVPPCPSVVQENLPR